jgi:hypothetical protein
MEYIKKQINDGSMRVRRGDLPEGARANTRVRLPASVPGTKPYNRGLVDDNMAGIQTYNKGTLFITFTANPQWAEVTEGIHLKGPP